MILVGHSNFADTRGRLGPQIQCGKCAAPVAGEGWCLLDASRGRLCEKCSDSSPKWVRDIMAVLNDRVPLSRSDGIGKYVVVEPRVNAIVNQDVTPIIAHDKPIFVCFKSVEISHDGTTRFVALSQHEAAVSPMTAAIDQVIRSTLGIEPYIPPPAPKPAPPTAAQILAAKRERWKVDIERALIGAFPASAQYKRADLILNVIDEMLGAR